MEREPITTAELPQVVEDFLVGFEGFAFAKEFVKKLGLTDADASKVLALAQDITLGSREISHLPSELEALGVHATDAKLAAAELAAKRLLPLEGMLGDVEEVIRSWGGDVEAARQAVQKVLPLLSPETYARQFLAEQDVRLPSPSLQQRLEEVLVEYLTSKITGKEATDLLMKDLKVGGLSMDKEGARGLLFDLAKQIGSENRVFVERAWPAAPERPISQAPKTLSIAEEFAPPAIQASVSGSVSVPASAPAPEPESGKKKAEKPVEPAPKAEPVVPKKPEPKPVPALEKKPVPKSLPKPVVAKPDLAPKEQSKDLEPKKIETPAPPPAKKPAEKIVLAPDLPVKKPVASPLVPVSIPAPTPSASETPSTAGANAHEDVFDEEDEAEIANIASKTKTIRESSGPLVDRDEAKARILDAVHLTFTDAELKKRFEQAVDSRLRDIRDAYATRDQLESAPEQGGIGLKGKELAEASATIEAIVSEYHEALAEKTQKEKQARMEQLRREREARDAKTKERERELLSHRYADVTGRVPQQAVSPVAPTGARTSVGSSAEAQLERQEKQIDAGRVKQVLTQSKQVQVPAQPLYSPGTMHPSGKQRMQDVRFARRLAGPAEELRTMDLTDFRRLSQNPVEAVKKIEDKIDLLGEDGFEKRIEGIKAWRESPINRQYLHVTQAAFAKGKPLDEILKEEEKAGNASLSRNDVNAIMELNAKLRF